MQRTIISTSIAAAVLIATIGSPERSDAAALDVFQFSQGGTMPTGTEGLNVSFTVPAGKQLVIEYVAGNCFVPAGQTCVFSIFTDLGGVTRQFNIETEGVGAFGGGGVLWRAGESVKLYANSGTTVMLRADRNAPSGTANITFMSLSGYLQ
jgi:hypothetical protein